METTEAGQIMLVVSGQAWLTEFSNAAWMTEFSATQPIQSSFPPLLPVEDPSLFRSMASHLMHPEPEASHTCIWLKVVAWGRIWSHAPAFSRQVMEAGMRVDTRRSG